MTEVKCTVNNCHYWENNICKAEEIQVAKNFLGNNDMEAGMMGKDSDTSSQTKCVTFIPKNKA